ncbi:LGSN protein, partial [Tricholaema leucomelas]|nr:LGSN protein [Tricholaema leucomelas]
QNTSESDNDEVDGNNMCGFRKKKGAKGPTKYLPPLENEKMELPHTSRVPEPCPPRGSPACPEAAAQPLHSMASSPPGQMDRAGAGSAHGANGTQEEVSGDREEIQGSAGTGKRAVGKRQGETEAPARSELPTGVQPARGSGKAGHGEAAGRAEGSEKAESEQHEWARMEEVKFHGSRMGSLGCSAEAFPAPPDLSTQSLPEPKTLLREGPLPARGHGHSGKAGGPLPQKNSKPWEKPGRPLGTLGPHFGEESRKQGLGQQGKHLLLLGSAGSDRRRAAGSDTDQLLLGLPAAPTHAASPDADIQFGSSADHAASSREPEVNDLGNSALLHLFSHIEFIKQQMARDSVQFVRFESIDLHGVSRSKNIPSRFFHEKAIHGVAMPRSYLELTLNPKDNELDYISATNFNCDIILNPDLCTFRVLPWTEQTARVICDSFTVLGSPLMTSPRHIAKRQLSQLQAHGFSLYSAFTYEFCIYGITEVVNSKTISFPAATILNNHDQSFIQELIEGMYYAGANIESFSSSSGPGQMEITFHPAFGIDAADSAFTFRTGIKEVAKKYNYVASFFSESGFYNSGALAHSLWDLNGQKNLFSAGYRAEELSEMGKHWLSGLLAHTAAISCLMAPTTSCRKPYCKYSKESKESVNVQWAYNDNSCAFNVKCHGGKGTLIENKLSSATANPYLVLAATIAAGLDGIKRGLRYDEMLEEENHSADLKHSSVPLKLEDALVALEKDSCIKEALGETFIRYFVAMKHYELETEEMDIERNKCLGYFI